MIDHSDIANTVAAKARRWTNPLVTALATSAISFCLVAASHAAPVTGDPQTNSFGWTPNSTNALNFAQQTPGRVGQVAPYVIFDFNAVGSVTLDFFNFASGLAFFETRIDDLATGVTAHPVVTGDTIHTGGTAVASGTTLSKTFFATNYVDIRLALGGERDWDFDWVRFEVQQANTVPLPGTLPLLALGIFGLIATRRQS